MIDFVENYIKVPSGCWEWQGCISPQGYGHVSIHRRKHIAHRVMYERYKGPIPGYLTINHLCENKKCVNPEHLEAVSVRKNLMYSDTPASRNVKKTHCPAGHEYTEENTYKYGRKRSCKACILLRSKSHKYYLSKRWRKRQQSTIK